MGRWIKGSGWYPNFRQPQLFRNGAMRYDSDPVHEGYELLTQRPLGRLESAIWQFPFRNLEEVIGKMNRYSSLGARKLAGKRVSMGGALGHGIWAFLKHYVFKRGYRDGWAGFVIALGNFEGTFYRYAKRYEEMQKWPPPASPPLRRRDDSAGGIRATGTDQGLGATAALPHVASAGRQFTRSPPAPVDATPARRCGRCGMAARDNTCV